MAPEVNATPKLVWMEGKLVPYTDAKVHILTHSLHYGAAVFEGIRAYRNTRGVTSIFRAREHLQRFHDSLKALGYQISYGLEDLLGACREVLRKNELTEAYLRPLAYIDQSYLGLYLPPNPSALVAIAAWGWGKYMGNEGQNKGVSIGTSTYRRPDVGTYLPMAKLSGNYLLSVMARSEATRNGYDEALLLDPEGFIAEGPGENIFMVKDGKIYTPPCEHILAGITRDSVIRIAQYLGHTVHEKRLNRNELYLADEVFFSGTAIEVNGIREIDRHPIGKGAVGPLTKSMMEAYFKCTRGEIPQFSEWLTQV